MVNPASKSRPGNKPKIAKTVIGVTIIAILLFLPKSCFYAEPGYIYHVKTLKGSNKVVTQSGYQFYPFASHDAWKQSITIQALETQRSNTIKKSDGLSARLAPLDIMFADHIAAQAQARVSFLLPSEPEAFLKLVDKYRSPDNLLQSALIPAFKETLRANASLMSAKDYYAGGNLKFNEDFKNQMMNGIYITDGNTITNAAVLTPQKTTRKNNQLKRKQQPFTDVGIIVSSAAITKISRPRLESTKSKQLQQKEKNLKERKQRIKEEEQRLLNIINQQKNTPDSVKIKQATQSPVTNPTNKQESKKTQENQQNSQSIGICLPKKSSPQQ